MLSDTGVKRKRARPETRWTCTCTGHGLTSLHTGLLPTLLPGVGEAGFCRSSSWAGCTAKVDWILVSGHPLGPAQDILLS